MTSVSPEDDNQWVPAYLSSSQAVQVTQLREPPGVPADKTPEEAIRDPGFGKSLVMLVQARLSLVM